jgi:hypothetical protein
MKWFNFLKKFKEPLKEKDPNDFTKCKSSTNWNVENSYCTSCKCTGSHSEYMSDVCNTCGQFDTIVLYGRSYRKIYYQSKWQYQIKYKNGKIELRENWFTN